MPTFLHGKYRKKHTPSLGIFIPNIVKTIASILTGGKEKERKRKKKKWNGLRGSLDPNNISASPHIAEEENLKFHLIPLKSIKEIRKSDLRLGKRRSFFDKIA